MDFINGLMKCRKYKYEYIIIASITAINLILHIIADFNSGYQGDELLHIEAGRHLAFGYMDFSPMIAFLAYIQNLFHSQSILVNHLFLHIATALIFVMCGLITIELGGSGFAVLITLSCIMFSPGFGASQSLFLPNVFDQLAWIFCIYCLVRYCNSSDIKYLIHFGIYTAIGFLTKYTITFLIGGLFISVLIFNFNILKNKALYISLLIFLIIITPNLLWQFNKGFPVLNHFSKLYETQLDNTSIVQELKLLFIYLNPFTSVFWIAGLLITPFANSFKNFRLINFTLLFAFIFLLIAKGKSYYYFPIILGLLPLGAVYFERLMQQRKWILTGYLSLICFSGIILLPHGIPLLKLDNYVKLYHFKKNSENKTPLPFENYYSEGIWNKVLLKVKETYINLPLTEQRNCLIWGRHYSQSCGINLLGAKYGLPQAFSFHSSCYDWVPDFSNNITIIGISDSNLEKDYWFQYFDEVIEIDSVENLYTSDYKWFKQHIYLCRKSKYNSIELKNIFKNEIF